MRSKTFIKHSVDAEMTILSRYPGCDKVPLPPVKILAIPRSKHVLKGILTVQSCSCFVAGYVMTYYHAEAGGHKLRVLTHQGELPVVVKLSCGAVAGAVAQSGRFPSCHVGIRVIIKF